jgi:two-component system nitrate/nitrite response regulator NarL
MPETGRVRVVVGDESVAATMRRCTGIEVVAECGDGAVALAAIRDLRPDVAVLDVLDGLGVLEALKGDGARPRVLLLSEHPAADLVFSALTAGAAGFLSKETDPEDVCAAVAAAGEGMTVLAPQLQAALAGDRPPLTDREHEVLRLTAEGHSAPELARLLFVSPGTVKTHLRSIYAKLGVSERAAAVAEAMRLGLLR